MPSAKTETTELAVAFGLLGIDDPAAYPAKSIPSTFDGTLSPEKHQDFVQEFSTTKEERSRLYKDCHEVGLKLRETYSPFSDLSQIRWDGPSRQASTTSIPRDLFAVNVPISVKASSDGVLNSSPHNLFVSTPSGSYGMSNSENWFYHTAVQEYQLLYDFVRDKAEADLPADVGEFDENATPEDRSEIQRVVAGFKANDRKQWSTLYKPLCHQVAEESADLFNQRFAVAGRKRSATEEAILRNLFRLDAVEYVLGGLDNKKQFAVLSPDLTAWKRQWKFVNLVASPDLSRGQSIVYFDFICEEKSSGTRSEVRFESQIRWSHGRFCGNPEAKLYKKFAWSEVPFFETLVE